ncbi:2-C-methyl-D-erythritol 4-phosphate cytidylyltransferase [bacterium]|nr:2-C-methyl-D-erythritol 4-phosphate cytidylyltransferase [bacterium]
MGKECKIGAVIVAAGSGLRFGEKKQFKVLGTKPLYLYSLKKFIDCEVVDEIVLVVPRDLQETVSNEISRLNPQIKVVEGGKLRQDSVLAGITGLSANCEIVCVHDAARPFVSVDLIQKTIIACKNNDGAIAGIPSHDTVKEVNINDNRIKRTIPRAKIWLAQTPQAFHSSQLVKALSYAKENNILVTDESTLLESLNYSMVVVEGSINNFKITTLSDWKLAELILERNND